MKVKVINVRIPYDWKDIDSENDNVDVSVDTDDGNTYVLTLSTPKNLQFLMDKWKREYYGSGYPCIIVNKLTPEIIDQTVKAFAEKNNGYWFKVYYFAGWYGAIDESIFDQIKVKSTKEQEKN